MFKDSVIKKNKRITNEEIDFSSEINCFKFNEISEYFEFRDLNSVYENQFKRLLYDSIENKLPLLKEENYSYEIS